MLVLYCLKSLALDNASISGSQRWAYPDAPLVARRLRGRRCAVGTVERTPTHAGLRACTRWRSLMPQRL